jgi:hypothetical protein
MWDLLCKRVNTKYIGIYVGYNCEDVSVNFSVRLKVTFSLVDTDKECYPVPPKGKCHKCSSSATVTAHFPLFCLYAPVSSVSFHIVEYLISLYLQFLCCRIHPHIQTFS